MPQKPWAAYRRRMIREIQYFQGRMTVTVPGTAPHTLARNKCRWRIKRLLAVDLRGHPAKYSGVEVPEGAENQKWE